MEQAVCLYIEYKNKVLGVCRRGTTDQWGLPGGKVDDGEDIKKAAFRELKEETGLIISDFKDLIEIYNAVCPAGKNGKSFNVTVFSVLNYLGSPKQGDAGPVDWVNKKDLLCGPFGQFNNLFFKELKLRKRFNKIRREFKSWTSLKQRSFLEDLIEEHAYYSGAENIALMTLDTDSLKEIWAEGQRDYLEFLRKTQND